MSVTGHSGPPVIESTSRATLHPRAVLPVKLGGRVVPEHILRYVQVFMLFCLLTFAVGAAVVVIFGADLITGITASVACLGNVGPGFGTVGPMSNFAALHPVSKIVLTLEMWIGRLEVTTVLVLLSFRGVALGAVGAIVVKEGLCAAPLQPS